MSEFTFENQGTNTYLVYPISLDETLDTMSLGMLTNNKIPGLAPTLFTQMDANQFIKYNVSAKVSVSQFFIGQVNRTRLLGVFNGIVNGLISAEDYMIDQSSIVLDLDYIFTDVSTCDTVLICLPVISTDNRTDLGKFFKEIMFNTQFDQTENCDHVAKIINYLNGANKFSLYDFKKVLDEIGHAPQASFVTKKVPEQQIAKETVQTTSNVQQPIAPPVAQPTVPVQPAAPVQPAIPPQPVAPVVEQPIQKKEEAKSDEKKMTFMYLMQHYSKKNAEIYKAQKEAEKSEKTDVKEKPKKEKARKEAPVQDFGFAIPGQPAPSPKPVEPEQKPVAPPVSQPSPAPVSSPAPAPSPVQTNIARSIPQGRPMNFGETTVLMAGNSGETTVLMANQTMNHVPTTPYLIRSKTSEKIQLNKPVFRIGKERSYVDYFVGDNTAVSRSHANFITRDGQHFVVDTNSTNHTFLNGTMLQSNQEYPIKPGDVIRLGNEDFEFKLF